MAELVPFRTFRPRKLLHPVVIAVPHAGRDYPSELPRLSRLPVRNLRVLEDRLADRLADRAFDAGFAGIVAQIPRAWIDLNRAENEFDPMLIDSPGFKPDVTRKVAGGLGIIPRRIGNGGDIWRARISAQDFAARLDDFHRPYHAAITNLLRETLEVFGVAILIDLHSMPPLRSTSQPPAEIVIGDRFGRSAADWIGSAALARAGADGIQTALNAPYAGGHSAAHHGRPQKGIHAIQIEVSRDLYLDRERVDPGPGLARMQQIILAIVSDVSAEAQGRAMPIAAE